MGQAPIPPHDRSFPAALVIFSPPEGENRRMRAVFNSRYDLHGNEIVRQVKLFVFHKVVPVGNLRGGPGLRCLVVLCLLHYFGRYLYHFQMRYGREFHALEKIFVQLKIRR